jgi:hypothetical protein
MNNTNNISARASYEKAKAMFFAAWLPSFNGNRQQCQDYVDQCKFSQSEVRLETILNATATNFKFALTPNQQNNAGLQFNTENRLKLQDTLCANEYGIYIGQPASNVDTAWQLRTNPNTQDFAAADVTALRTTFYSHGFLRMTCNNDVIIPYRGLVNHLYYPQTQETAPLGAASPNDQFRGAEDGLITDEPNILLIGSKGYEIELILPTAMASAAAFMRAVIIFKGVLAQNSTPVS